MKNTIFFLPLLLICFSISTATADHALGTDIRWESLNSGKYKITVDLYRDCNGCDLGSNPCGGSVCIAPHILISSKGCKDDTLELSVVAKKDVTPVCGTQCTPCSQCTGCTFKFGATRITLVGIYDFSTSIANGCCQFTLSTSICCRSKSISTGAANQNFYTYAELNACIKDNSPVFTNDPVLYLCRGLDVAHSMGGVDPDRDSITGKPLDSLYYSLVTPLQGVGRSVSWSGSYDYTKPLYFPGFPKETSPYPRGFHFDPFTGDLKFRPLSSQTSVMTIQVEHFRAGKKIGLQRRDFQVTVTSCPNNSNPEISGINCTAPSDSNFIGTACVGEKIWFTLCTSDKDKNDTVKMSWNSGIPGATFTILNPGDSFEKAEFNWTATENDRKNGIHSFTVEATDNNCPFNATTSARFYIKVIPNSGKKVDTMISPCGKVSFLAHSPGDTATTYQWQIDGKSYLHKADSIDTVNFVFPKPGLKQFTLKISPPSGCPVIFTDSLSLKPFLSLESMPDTTACQGATFSMRSVMRNHSKHAKQWWSTGDSLTSRISFSIGKRDTFVIAYAQDSNCSTSDTIFIKVGDPIGVDLGTDIVRCAEDKGEILAPTLNLPSGITGSTLTYSWFKDSRAHFVSSDSVLIVEDSGMYILEVRDAMLCPFADSLLFYKETALNAAFIAKNACINDSTIFINNSPYVKTYAWDFGDGATSTDREPIHIFTKLGKYAVKLKVITAIGCKADTVLEIIPLKGPEPTFRDTTGCEGSYTSFRNTTTDAVTGYSWIFGDGQYSSDQHPAHIFNNAGDFKVTLKATGINGCSGYTNRMIIIDPIAKLSFSTKGGCVNEPVKFSNTSSISKGTISYKWLLGDGNTSSSKDPLHTYNKTGTFQVTLSATTNKGCSTSIKKDIVIDEKPKFILQVPDVCLNELSVVPDSVRKAIKPEWSSVWLTGDGPVYLDTIPNYRYTAAGSYRVELKVSKANGCRDSLLTKTNVFPLPNPDFTYKYIDSAQLEFTGKSGALTYLWNFGDGDSAKGRVANHQFKKTGAYAVNLLVIDSNGCGDTSITQVNVKTIGIDEVQKQVVAVFPNPFTNNALLTYSLTEKSQVTVQLFDIQGRKLADLVNTMQEIGDYSYTIDDRNISSRTLVILQIAINQNSKIIPLLRTK